MSQEADGAYYRKRLAQEQKLAHAATDPAIVAIHREMAKRYAELADGGDARRA